MQKRLLALEEQFRKEKEHADQQFEEQRKVKLFLIHKHTSSTWVTELSSELAKINILFQKIYSDTNKIFKLNNLT